MIETVSLISSILGIIMFVAWLSDEYKKRKVSLFKMQNDIAVTDADKQNAIRDIGNKSDLKFIESLPEEKSITYRNAQQLWDTGTTVSMKQGNYDVIDFLKSTWLKLSEFYTSNNFGLETSEEYVDRYIRERFEYHHAKHSPNGERNSGTIVGVLVGADVITDLDSLVDNLVGTISFYNDEFDYLEWKKRWANMEAQNPT